MERRVVAGAAATLLVVVVAAFANVTFQGDYVAAVLLAGMAGGVVAGALTPASQGGHVGAGARAGGYGGGAAFVLFVAVGAVQAVIGGDLSVLYLGFQSLLVALLVVPLHAFLGAGAAAIAFWTKRALALERGTAR